MNIARLAVDPENRIVMHNLASHLLAMGLLTIRRKSLY